MSSFFSQENPVWSFFSKAADVVFMNVLFIICCLPVVTIGPAYTALYYTMMKSVRRERGYAFKNFFHSFLQNLKQGIGAWLILLFFGLASSYGVWLLWGATSGGSGSGLLGFWISVFVLLFIICITIYIFPVLSRFSFSFGTLFAFSFMLIFRHALITLLLVMLFAACVLVCYFSIPLFIICMPALTVLISSFLIETVFKKYMSTIEQRSIENGTAEESADPWYYE